jgi:hypothetical protein
MADAQHGVVASRQLMGLGYSREGISRAVSNAELHRIHHGVYAVGHRALSRKGLCMAAILTCGDGALLSHSSAAWLWGLAGRLDRPLEVTAVSPRRSRHPILVHSSATLRPADRASTGRIPATAVPRTILDLFAVSRSGSPPNWVLARAERLGSLDLIAIDSLLAESAGQRGVRRLRHALVDFRVPVFSRSGLERRFLRLVKDAGLPQPSTNLFVCGYELDAYWDEFRFAVELDTYDYHGDPSAFERDRLRQEDLKLAGIEMTRITGRRISREPAAVARRLQALLTQRQKTLPSAGG